MIPILLVTFAALLSCIVLRTTRVAARPRRRHRKPSETFAKVHGFQQRKPAWVRKEVLRLKALLPDGARKIADTFMTAIRATYEQASAPTSLSLFKR